MKRLTISRAEAAKWLRKRALGKSVPAELRKRMLRSALMLNRVDKARKAVGKT